MARSISELNRLLQDERARSLCLLEENQRLQSKVFSMLKPAPPESQIGTVTPADLSDKRHIGPIEMKPVTVTKDNSSNKEHNAPSKTNSKKKKKEKQSICNRQDKHK